MAGQEGRTRRSPTPTGSRTPSLFLVGLGEEREGERGGKERGGAAPLLVQSGLEGGAASDYPLVASPLPPIGPMKPNSLRGVPVTPRYSGIYPITPGTISRLLVMSVITSGTPNYLQYIKTHKLII